VVEEDGGKETEVRLVSFLGKRNFDDQSDTQTNKPNTKADGTNLQ